MKLKTLLVSALVSTFLVACGGGGSTASVSTNASAVDKFVGSWLSNCDAFNERTRLTITKLSDTTFRVISATTDFGAANCATTNNPQIVLTVEATVTLDGTKTIAGTVVDKLNLVAVVTQTTDNTQPVGTTMTLKDVVKSSATQLEFGNTDTTASKDADGFPNLLDPAETYIKQ
jgi:hypothetical protein